MRLSYLLSKDVASRLPFTHPPEPRKEMLLSSPFEGVYIGKTRFMHVPVFWNPDKLINPHIAIIGITGSGKSYTVKTFITRASLIWNSNALILDWVGEYDKWVRQAGGRVIDLAKEKLNILDLVGLPKSSRIKQIMAAFDLLADLRSFPNERDEIEEALEVVYDKKRKPILLDVINYLIRKKRQKAARLLKRFTTEGSDFFAGGTTLDIKKLTNSGLVCVDLHNLPTEEMRSLAGLTILQYVKELMRTEGMQEGKKIRLFVVLDEAWKIAQDEKSDVVTIVREGRKYNFSLIIATQNPTDIHKTIFSNMGTIITLRLILKEYRDFVKESIGYSDFIDQEVAKFGVGDAAVNMIFSERQDRVTTFLMEKIDGEDPLFIYKINGGGMDIEIEREQFIKMLYELGLTESQLSIVKKEFEKKDGMLDGEVFVELLERFGYSRSSIISFLRQLGFEEKNIVRIFSLAKMRKAARGVVSVIMEE
ncbi:MAG: ATP-binding protein [Candidatus Bilamarchaeaceae archaeon]